MCTKFVPRTSDTSQLDVGWPSLDVSRGSMRINSKGPHLFTLDGGCCVCLLSSNAHAPPPPLSNIRGEFRPGTSEV